MGGGPAGGVYVPANLSLFSYAHQKPVIATDPEGKFVWFIPLAYIAVEAAFTAYDVYDVTTTLMDEDASTTEKVVSAGGLVAEIFLPGGGYSAADDVVGGGVAAVRWRVDDDAADIAEAGTKQVDDAADISGGAHRDTSKPTNDGLDSHHCPAKNCYADAPISAADGPAIKMDPDDHRLTGSYGSSKEAVAYRETQAQLLSEGRLMEAIDMGVQDIRATFGDGYDAEIEQMLEYARTP